MNLKLVIVSCKLNVVHNLDRQEQLAATQTTPKLGLRHICICVYVWVVVDSIALSILWYSTKGNSNWHYIRFVSYPFYLYSKVNFIVWNFVEHAFVVNVDVVEKLVYYLLLLQPNANFHCPTFIVYNDTFFWECNYRSCYLFFTFFFIVGKQHRMWMQCERHKIMIHKITF